MNTLEPEMLACTREMDESRWQQIVSGDSSCPETFFFAVKTTGIFCRPNCKSRKPLRQNVVFFDTAQDAVRSGFRPCLKCRPAEVSPVAGRHPQLELACRLLEESKKPLTAKQVACSVGLSPFQLQRLFQKSLGMTPSQYAKARRLQSLGAQLASGIPLLEAVLSAGFESVSAAYAASKRDLGSTPGQFRAAAVKEQTGYVTMPCLWGTLLLALTRHGVCWLSLGSCEQQLIEELKAAIPHVKPVANSTALEQLISQACHAIEQPRQPFPLPLDIQGTVFQIRVWQALRQIPAGETRTYAQIAASLGQPQAARAVAKACAQNHLAVAVPCHRVIGSDGQMRGYRWGLERKQALLLAERPNP